MSVPDLYINKTTIVRKTLLRAYASMIELPKGQHPKLIHFEERVSIEIENAGQGDEKVTVIKDEKPGQLPMGWSKTRTQSYTLVSGKTITGEEVVEWLQRDYLNQKSQLQP